MSLADTNLVDLLGTFLGLIFTLSVFSYILGDNVSFRLAIHIFIGVAAGLAAAIAMQSVIVPHLLSPLLSGDQSERLLAIVPLILSGLLLMKATRRYAFIGSPVMAFLVGAGAAAAIGGAIMGTLFPQISASVNLFDIEALGQNGQDWLVQLLYGGFILIGTVTTLAYFHFGARAPRNRSSQGFALLRGIAWIGQTFIAITFGVLYAGILGSALTALIERLNFIWNFILSFVMPAS